MIRRNNAARRLLALMIAGLGLGAIAGPVSAAPDDPTDLLDTERWRENKYGVSFLPPVGSKVVRQTADEALVRIVGKEPAYEIAIDVKQAEESVKLAWLVESSKNRQERAHPDSKLLQARALELSGMPAHRLSYRIPVPARRTDAILEQMLIQMGPRSIAVVEMRGAFNDADQLRTLFDAVLGTLEIADQAELAKRRREAVSRTRQWRDELTVDDLKAAAGDTAYFRVVHDDRDLGWMEVERKTGQFNGQQGVAVLITSHLRLRQGRIESRGRYFRPFDGPVGGTWSVKTTYRFADPNKPPRSAVETGTVTDEQVEVRIDANTGEKNEELRFRRRPIGYLPQADAWLLGRLLPHDTATTYGFYWYNRRERKVTFRSDKVTPALDGFVITTRLSPNGPELRATYDRAGRLQEKELGRGRRLIRSTAEALENRWQGRR